MRETIEALERVLSISLLNTDRYADFKESLINIKAACRKQEAEQIQELKEFRDEDAYLYFSGICPSCGNCINNKNDDIFFCYKCGQKIEWRKEQ